MPTLSEEAKTNISIITDGLPYNNNNIEELQQVNTIFTSTNFDIMQQLKQITA